MDGKFTRREQQRVGRRLRIAAAARAVLGDRPAIALALEESGVDPNRLPSVLKSAQAWIERPASGSEVAAAPGESRRAGPAQSRKLSLLKAVARGRKWSQELLAGRVQSVREIARRENCADRYVRELLPLGFFAPAIVEAIVGGRRPPELTVIRLIRRLELPVLWSAQEQVVGLR